MKVQSESSLHERFHAIVSKSPTGVRSKVDSPARGDDSGRSLKLTVSCKRAVDPKVDGNDQNWVVICIKVGEHVRSLSIKVDGSKI